MSADFSGLRKSIMRLQIASEALDAEKADAELKFRELLDKLPGRKTAHEGGCGHARHLPGWLRRILRKIFSHGIPEPVRKFIEAAKRVQRANAKLVAFEKGFISEEGIKDREWYRHLGVAPGKWLGEWSLDVSFPVFRVSFCRRTLCVPSHGTVYAVPCSLSSEVSSPFPIYDSFLL